MSLKEHRNEGRNRRRGLSPFRCIGKEEIEAVTKKKKGRNPLGVLCTILGTLALVVLIVACIPLTVPRMLGYELYTVVSGSMEPAIPTGSLVYVEHVDPTEVAEGDVIAFYSAQDASSVITHRVVTNSTVMGEFITKGDANEENDMSPISYASLIGRVAKSIPKAGALAQTFTSSIGKIAAGSLMGLGVVLNLIGGLMNRKRER